MTPATSDSLPSVTTFTLGPWRVEPHRNVISRDGEKRHLENRLMQTLVFLASHQGQVCSREQFFAKVWQDRVVNEEALSRAISLLRSALEDDARSPRYIQTIPGVGYRLVAPVDGTADTAVSLLNEQGLQQNSIAVLPFVNLSEDPANEYFSDGITEEILNVLAQGNGFKVVSRTSSFMFKGSHQDLREIGRILDVAHVLEGSVRKAGTRVRITAQLIKAADGFHLWSEAFDRELEDVFAIQDEIAAAVAHALEVKLLGVEVEPQSIGGTGSSEAFEAYLQGLHHRNRGSVRQSLFQARDAFQRAVQLDPRYAKAWAALSFTLCELIWNSFVEFTTGRQQVEEAVTRAIELSPRLAEAHLGRAFLLQLGIPKWGPISNAIAEAVRCNPSYGPALIEYSRINCNLGKSKRAIAGARKALELDPISVYANHLLGHILYFCREYEAAIPALKRALELDPSYPKPRYFMAMSHHWLGDSERAWEVIQDEPLEWMNLYASAVILDTLGREEESRAAFERLVEMGVEETNDIQQADVHAQLGETDQAIECLYRALDNRDPGLAQLLVDPFLDPIREDRRFMEIMEMVGLARFAPHH